MKAIRIHEFGGPDQVRIDDVPLPRVTAGKVLVHVHAAAVNPVDWMIREHIYNPAGADRVPLTLGQDFSGVVAKIGARSGTSFHEGDEVFGETWGSFAEYARVPASDLVHKPKNLDFVTAASIPMPSLTAWQAVVDTAGARPGMRFLVHGASGGVGAFAVQFAKLKGAEVFATASAPSFEYLRGLGVSRIVDYQHERFEQEVHDMDVVLDPLGGDVQARSWSILKPGGMLINLVGEIDDDAARQAGVRGVMFGMRYDTEDLREIAALVERGAVKPHVTQVLPLERAREALDLNQQGRSHGKIVLEVAWGEAGA
ncbi:NADP-dependent oxidoreductase [Anaeromyxobacter oryzisoli]|uniref:NADP-dependent oxidoreductase n=1 Tax=Anaeromyxobacter oryzisoli TaxID=2925408 RepID=UPI001F578CCE|nr:NADP-dependent oxidoreductase [Anaeromyxobacter sp. SG63]